MMDAGMAKNVTTTTLDGRHLRLHLRAEGADGWGSGIQGNKITKITK